METDALMAETNFSAIRHYDGCYDSAERSEQYDREARDYNVDKTFQAAPRIFNSGRLSITTALSTYGFNVTTFERASLASQQFNQQ